MIEDYMCFKKLYANFVSNFMVYENILGKHVLCTKLIGGNLKKISLEFQNHKVGDFLIK